MPNRNHLNINELTNHLLPHEYVMLLEFEYQTYVGPISFSDFHYLFTGEGKRVQNFHLFFCTYPAGQFGS